MQYGIKTLSEYRALVEEYKESDSVRQRESITDVVYTKARALLHKLITLYSKYGKDFVEDNNIYKKHCDSFSLIRFDKSAAWMKWSDDRTIYEIEVQMKYLDNDKMTALEKKLRKEHVANVKRKIQEKKRALKRLKKAAEELETEIKELESEKSLKNEVRDDL